jgi:ribonuclease HII
MSLTRFYCENRDKYEICIDEAGRGSLFGRVYIAAVVLPKDPELFVGDGVKDSKKFSSKKKIAAMAEYIKTNALIWHIAFVDEKRIDEINILQAAMRGMHECIREILGKLQEPLRGGAAAAGITDCLAVIDGNYFTPYCSFDNDTESIVEMPHVTVEKGDSLYMGIAAASILAKTARDNYVLEMTKQYPDLSTKYGLHKNMGYGTKEHLRGIGEHGITEWHRRTFGVCKSYGDGGGLVVAPEQIGH